MDKIQCRALETWYDVSHPLFSDLMPATLGLVGEAGEFADLVKKDKYKPGVTLRVEDFVEELGDVLYYLAILANWFGYTLDDISILNHSKLASREKIGNGYNRGNEREV